MLRKLTSHKPGRPAAPLLWSSTALAAVLLYLQSYGLSTSSKSCWAFSHAAHLTKELALCAELVSTHRWCSAKPITSGPAA